MAGQECEQRYRNRKWDDKKPRYLPSGKIVLTRPSSETNLAATTLSLMVPYRVLDPWLPVAIAPPTDWLRRIGKDGNVCPVV